MLTGPQHATALVYAYPHFLDIDMLLDYLASQHNEPSRQELLQPAYSTAAPVDWEDVYEYIKQLKHHDHFAYIPFLKQPNSVHNSKDTEAHIYRGGEDALGVEGTLGLEGTQGVDAGKGLATGKQAASNTGSARDQDLFLKHLLEDAAASVKLI